MWQGVGPKSKGFLTMAEEIEAVKQANSEGNPQNGEISIAINWARSVLETHDVDAAPKHVVQAAEVCVRDVGCNPHPHAAVRPEF